MIKLSLTKSAKIERMASAQKENFKQPQQLFPTVEKLVNQGMYFCMFFL